MLLALIIFYVVTLVYAAITERFRHYAMLIGLQGWLLLGVALLRLHGIDWLELSFVLVETLVFKAVVMPCCSPSSAARASTGCTPARWPSSTS